MVKELPQYKKKNVKRHRRSAKNVITDDVVMTNSKNNEKHEYKTKSRTPNPERKKINIIRGNKYRNRYRRLAIALTCLVIAGILTVISLLTPTGITETIINLSASLKSGNVYPVKLSGGTLVSSTSQDNHVFLVSTTNFECYNNSGKNIFSYQHGHQAPILSVSEARTLLYDQSGKNYSVYNLNSQLLKGTTEREILAANIARNGNFAIATLSDSYSSMVTVYDKKGNSIFEWYCADYTINAVLLSPNGKQLAVSAISAVNGAFISRVYVLEFDSADAKQKYDYNDLILGIEKVSNSGFAMIGEHNSDFINWKKGKIGTFSTDDNVILSRSYKSSLLLVTGRTANKNKSTVSVFDAKGNNKHSFVFEGIINNIEYKGTEVYILSEKTIYKYSVKGELLGSTQCEFGTRFIYPISKSEISSITDNIMRKLNF